VDTRHLILAALLERSCAEFSRTEPWPHEELFARFSFTLTDPVHDVQRRTPFPLLNQKSVSALESTMEMASSLSMKGVEKKMIEIGKGSLTVDAFELSGETYIE